MTDFTPITEALIACNREQVMNLVKSALDQGVAAKDVLNQGLIAGMDVIGEKMEKGELFIPEVLMAAKIMSGAVDELKPLLSEEDVEARGKVVIGTVKGDLHDIGKNLVSMLLESTGMEVFNVGVDVEPDAFISEVKTHQADFLCLSALLTTTMPMMKETIKAVMESGIRDEVKVLVGGAPVTKNFADEIGADGYAPDAGSATKLVKSMLK